MDEATKKKLKEAGLDGVIASFDKLAGDLKTATQTKTDLEKSVAEKDAIIAQKTDDLVKARKAHTQEFKALKDMTEAEKAALSEKEKELITRQEQIEARAAEIEKAQKETLQKEIDSRRQRAIDRIAGKKDPELRKKVEDNFKKIVDHDKAQTEEEISAITEQAYNMLGIPKADPIITALNGGDGEAGGERNSVGFADKPEGKALANSLNLKSGAEEATK